MIVGLHIAKTGGTSLLHHAKDHLRADEIEGQGPNRNATLFFEGRTLLEERSADENAALKFLLGHGVSSRTLVTLGRSDVRLFLAMRSPYSHFVSRYRHSLAMKKDRGLTWGPKQFLDQFEDNPVSRNILTQFSDFTEGDSKVSIETMTALLRQFRYLAITEDLKRQTEALCAYLGVPALDKHSRPARNQAEIDLMSPEALLARTDVDQALFDLIRTAPLDDRAGSAIAYDHKLFERGLERARARFKNIDLVARAYERLADFIQNRQMTEAAQLELALSGRTGAQFAPILALKVETDQRQPAQKAMALERMGRVYLRHGEFRNAENCFEDAVALNPKLAISFEGLGRALIRMGEPAKARDRLAEGLQHHPQHEGLMRLTETLN